MAPVCPRVQLLVERHGQRRQGSRRGRPLLLCAPQRPHVWCHGPGRLRGSCVAGLRECCESRAFSPIHDRKVRSRDMSSLVTPKSCRQVWQSGGRVLKLPQVQWALGPDNAFHCESAAIRPSDSLHEIAAHLGATSRASQILPTGCSHTKIPSSPTNRWLSCARLEPIKASGLPFMNIMSRIHRRMR